MLTLQQEEIIRWTLFTQPFSATYTNPYPKTNLYCCQKYTWDKNTFAVATILAYFSKSLTVVTPAIHSAVFYQVRYWGSLQCQKSHTYGSGNVTQTWKCISLQIMHCCKSVSRSQQYCAQNCTKISLDKLIICPCNHNLCEKKYWCFTATIVHFNCKLQSIVLRHCSHVLRLTVQNGFNNFCSLVSITCFTKDKLLKVTVVHRNLNRWKENLIPHDKTTLKKSSK